jgi:MFS family permease
MTVGPLICAIALVMMSRIGAGASYWVTVLPPVILFGVGLSLLVAPLTATALGVLDDAHAGIASGVNNAVARAAGLLSVAVLPLAAGLGSGSLTNPADLHPTYRNAMLICAALMAVGGILAVLLIPTRLPDHTPESPTPPTSPPPISAPSASAPPASSAEAAPAMAVAALGPRRPSPIRTYCDPSGPPVQPRDHARN